MTDSRKRESPIRAGPTFASLAVALALTLAAATAAAQDAGFSRLPDWSSAFANRTRATALGDVDGDGDLDLVCGNWEEGNTLCLNEGGTFSPTPVWFSSSITYTSAVALGDVDGDGDLDLVCGNAAQSNTLYLNDGGTFPLTPDWSSSPAYNTGDVALADVDDDGDLDLVCGNWGNNTLYRNDGGTLSETPAWSSGTSHKTDAVTLGDVDGDGDLDLACGNWSEENTLYRNEGGTFSTAPVWTSAPTRETLAAALGDVDGDGDLDLVCGNRYEANTVYLNDGGLFSATPDWSSWPGSATFAVALGDVDGDGDLDLVCGNSEENDALYVNESGALFPAPDWYSIPQNDTRTLALGDVDGDGDLDLVCGNELETNTLYLNGTAALPTAASWSSTPTNRTLAVALGDVNGDGNLDLLCGNGSHPNTLYLGGRNGFSATPVWSSSANRPTVAVALGDLDGDGDPDLVCGNWSQPNAIHRNDDGVLSETPAWSSPPSHDTFATALGDVDGDGDLDLVFGNAGRNTLYLNAAGEFSEAAWYPLLHDTRGVALGDVDGDRDLDVVCGNWSGGSTLYLNEGGVFADVPVWSSDPNHRTSSVALGDVDGDGDLDLACGNDGRNRLFRNEGGTFTATPVWSSDPSDYTRSVALADVEGDGDLDLVCTNGGGSAGGQSNTIYRNDAGTLSSTPTWSSATAGKTAALALGDVDADGDLDLVGGNEHGSNELYAGLEDPAYKGDPEDPRNHLPNNGAHLRNVRRDRPDPNVLRVRFLAVDVESDPVWVFPRYQYAGTPEWYPIGVPGTGLAGLASSPEGVEHELQWDISLLPFDVRDAIVQLRTVSHPSRVGLIRHAPSYELDLGPLVPIRGEITASATSLTFPTVTLGDTVFVSFVVSNPTGNGTLIISDVAPPSSEMRVANSLPIHLEPLEADTLTVFLEPRLETGIAGELTITSSDPFRPSVAISVQTDIRELDVETSALTEEDEVPLGDFLMIVVTPEESVNIERGALWHRAAGSGAAFSTTELVESGSAFIGVIRGDEVTEAGVEYWVEVENSGVFDTDPPGAPADSTFFQAVESPTALATDVISASGDDLVEGQSVIVQVALPVGAVFSSGVLHHREGGARKYGQIPFELTGFLPEATIPGASVGSRGLEYWVQVVTATTTLTDPAEDPSENPRGLQVAVTRLEEPSSHAGRRYRTFSVPLDFGNSSSETIEAMLSDHPEFGPFDSMRWQAWAWATDEKRYVGIGDAVAGEHLRPAPGRALWLVCRNEHRVDTAPLTGKSTPTAEPFEVPLAPGWTMLGDPFGFPVSWDSVVVNGGSIREDGLLTGPIRWDPETAAYDYEPARVLDPFEGYWIHNAAGEVVTLRIPAVDVGAPSIEAAASGRVPAVAALSGEAAESSGPGWRLVLDATTASGARGEVVLGAHSDASDGHDRRDVLAPPTAPGSWIRFGADHGGWRRRPGLYWQDFRTPGAEGHRFDLLVRSAEVEEIRLLLSSDAELPPVLRLRLIDLEQKTSIDPLAAESCRLLSFGPERSYRLALLVGTEAFVARQTEALVSRPSRLTLDQNAPNPFGSATRVRFGLPSGGPVVLEIFDVRGARVASLVNEPRPPGYHTVLWDGRDPRGRRVAAGVYFYRVSTPDGVLTRKLTLLR